MAMRESIVAAGRGGADRVLAEAEERARGCVARPRTTSTASSRSSRSRSGKILEDVAGDRTRRRRTLDQVEVGRERLRAGHRGRAAARPRPLRAAPATERHAVRRGRGMSFAADRRPRPGRPSRRVHVERVARARSTAWPAALAGVADDEPVHADLLLESVDRGHPRQRPAPGRWSLRAAPAACASSTALRRRGARDVRAAPATRTRRATHSIREGSWTPSSCSATRSGSSCRSHRSARPDCLGLCETLRRRPNLGECTCTSPDRSALGRARGAPRGVEPTRERPRAG